MYFPRQTKCFIWIFTVVWTHQIYAFRRAAAWKYHQALEMLTSEAAPGCQKPAASSKRMTERKSKGLFTTKLWFFRVTLACSICNRVKHHIKINFSRLTSQPSTNFCYYCNISWAFDWLCCAPIKSNALVQQLLK